MTRNDSTIGDRHSRGQSAIHECREGRDTRADTDGRHLSSRVGCSPTRADMDMTRHCRPTRWLDGCERNRTKERMFIHFLRARLFFIAKYCRILRRQRRPSVCPVDRQQQWRPAGLLLSALWTGDIDRQHQLRAPCCRRRCTAANAGSVMLRADGGGSTQTWILFAILCRLSGHSVDNDTDGRHCRLMSRPWLQSTMLESSSAYRLRLMRLADTRPIRYCSRKTLTYRWHIGALFLWFTTF